MEELGKLTAERILSDEVLSEVFDQEDEIYKARLLLSLTDRAEELKIKGKFTKLVAAYKKEDKKMKRTAGMSANEKYNSVTNQTSFDFFEDGHELNCGNWIANEQGVIEYNAFGLMQRACYHPILPIQFLKNAETGKEKVKLAFKKGFNWNEITVDRGVLASASRIVGLADYGVSVTSENAKLLVRFMSDIENLNLGEIENKVSTSKLGWIRGEFMPYGFDVEFDSKEKFKDIFESVAEYGSKAAWFECVNEIRRSGRKEPLVYLAGSFASVLLKPLNLLPFIVNLWSESGKGKTVALMVATSIWANPAEGKYMTDPSATAVSLEIRDDILNHLPLVIDDLSKMRDKYGDAFTDMIYMLCGGKGKDRSNVNLGLNKPTTWQNIILTNIERPLATETMRGGAINRILDFEMEEGSVFTDGNAVVKAVSNNYGYAGRMFVEIVKDLGFDEIRGLQQEYLEQIRRYCKENKCEKEEKQMLPLSVMLAADKIATDYIFKDGIYLDFEWCVSQLKGLEEVSENERAYEFIMSEVQININKFKPDNCGEYKGEVWGAFEKEYVVILNNVFNRICEKGNFSGKAFLSWAAKRDMVQGSCGKNSKTKRICGTPSRCVVLKLPEEECSGGADGFVSLEDYEQSELPFE